MPTTDAAMPAMRVGVIGLGVMGRPMAANLMRAGFPVAVYARRAASAGSLVAEGAVYCESPASLAERCDAIITMVTADADVEQVLFGESGAAQGLAAGTLVIDHSTISPSTARACAASARSARSAIPVRPAATATGSTVLRDETATLLPAAARSSAIARPKRRPPPQTNTRAPSSSMGERYRTAAGIPQPPL
jgi:2-hydroxy-3-oxopropionate reductase